MTNSKEKNRLNQTNFRKNSAAKASANRRKWRQANPDKVCYDANMRNARKSQAMPSWLTKEHRAQIQWFYTTAKELQWLSEEQLHVDHIEPLNGKISCGLHVPWNLQILPKSKNLSKGNKLNENI